MVKNVIIFRVDMSSAVHIDNKNIYILIIAEGLTYALEDIKFTAEAKYPNNFTQSAKKNCRKSTL